MVKGDSYTVQNDSNMVESDIHGCLEPNYGPKLTRIKVIPRGGQRMSNFMYMMLTC